MANIIRAVGNYLNPVEFVPELAAGALLSSVLTASCCSSSDIVHNVAAGIGIVGGFCLGKAHHLPIRYGYDPRPKEKAIRGAVRSLTYVGALTLVEILEEEAKQFARQVAPILENGLKYGLSFGASYLLSRVGRSSGGGDDDQGSDLPEEPPSLEEELDLRRSRLKRLRRFEPTLN